MQIIGSVLQLVGSFIALVGLSSALRKTTGKLTRLGDAYRDWLSELTESLVARFRPPPSAPPTPAGGISATVQTPTMTAKGEVLPPSGVGGPEGRIAILETENAKRADEIRAVADALRTEIGAAVGRFKTLSDAIRLKDLYWALGGLAVNIIGIGVQLGGQLGWCR